MEKIGNNYKKSEYNRTTDQVSCRMIVDVLKAKGVKHVVLSPGSRNAPLLVAFAREEGIHKWVIVDERSAAFVAVGLAQQSETPVALVCTSGSAVLNYAPAVSEAYYQQLPLVVISADRPIEWIDQNDSQTIRQTGALANIVKKTFDIPASCNGELERWWVNRMLNEAVTLSFRNPQAPVHINVQLCEPLCGEAERVAGAERVVTDVEVERKVSSNAMAHFTQSLIAGKQVMVLAGICKSSKLLNDALSTLAKLPNVVVMTETLANMSDKRFIATIDRTLQAVPYDKRNEYAPDILITFGGALVSRMIKQFLRKFPAQEQWRIGVDNGLIDTMQHLSSVVNIDPKDFFIQLAESLADVDVCVSDYAKKWKEAEVLALKRHKKYIGSIGWCDLKAFSLLLPSIPEDYNLQLSNGTTVRYAQLFDTPNVPKSNCNRGVAGIDGATSTALGASLACDDVKTVLITGDMSLSYDLNGMASQYNSGKFKIIVMCNGGGGIFRFIKGPSDLPELERYFEVTRNLPIDKYAEAFGYDYFFASSDIELMAVLPGFWKSDNASILAINTPSDVNAELLRKYFRALR